LHQTASYVPLCIKISSVVLLYATTRKMKGKERKEKIEKVTELCYISRVCREDPRERILIKFSTTRAMVKWNRVCQFWC